MAKCRFEKKLSWFVECNFFQKGITKEWAVGNNLQ